MEGKNSTLKEELVTLKEALNKANLEKDVLEQEKAEIGEKPEICLQNSFPFLSLSVREASPRATHAMSPTAQPLKCVTQRNC